MQNLDEDFKKCNCCGKYFKNLASNKVCFNCNNSGHYDYMRIHNYLWENYGQKISATKISVVLNIKLSRILKFVEEGRFGVVENQGSDMILDVKDLKSAYEKP